MTQIYLLLPGCGNQWRPTPIEALLSEKNAGYTEYQEKKQRVNELLTIKRNIDLVHHGASSQRRDEHG